ncbi:alpha-1-antitrypsin-like isoform X2 [Sceloporus undulatus]|nr:alpha-1-antitrypsin-like isoform X2 [Sceloporus undulatus]
MFNFYVDFLIAGLLCFAHSHHVPTHHHHDHHPPSEDHSNSSYLKIAPRNAYFAFKVFHQLVSENAGKNVFFSPLSISAAFAMVSMGAKSNTLSQLLTALGFNQTEFNEQEIHEGFHQLLHLLNLPQSETELSTGNALFTHEENKILTKFLDDARHYYHADVFPTNFTNLKEAELQINSYIENKTQMRDVIQGLDKETVMVLVNYIFFKAYWLRPFYAEYTREDDFFVDEQTTVKVPMMITSDMFKFYHDKDLSCQVVQVPYKGKASALFILPDPGKLKLVEDALGKDVLFKWLSSLQYWHIDLYLPRFSVSSSHDVKEVLQSLGATKVFTNCSDLSGISENPKMKVSKAIHKAYLNVYENGTEAAAGTFLSFSPQSEPHVIKFQNPFLVILSLENNILFMGSIKNPTDK